MRRSRKTGKQERFTRIVLFFCVPAFLIFFSGSLRAAPVVIGSKKFTESYVLGEIAKRGFRTISDLRNHPELKFGLTHEFLDRQDGWRPLAQDYQLNPRSVIGIDHALGYAALASGSIDVKDAYSTDARISENDLVVLEDDHQFFPQYKAVFLFSYALSAPP